MTKSSNVESTVSFLSADQNTKLSGILSVPAQTSVDDKFPCLLFTAGSGPIDADGTARSSLMPVIPINIQKLTSEELTQRIDMVTLRFDKRGISGSAGTDPNLFYKAGIDEFVCDAVGAYIFLASHDKVDKNRIIVVGHSEGCVLIPAINKKLTSSYPELPPIYAGAFLAGLGESIPHCTAYQQKLLGEEIKTAPGFQGFILRAVYGSDPQARIEKKAEQQFAALRDSKSDYTSILFGLVKTPAKWWRDHLDYTIPGKLQDDYALIRFHVLGITGEYDIQVDPTCLDQDLASLMPFAASIQTNRLPKVSHLLRECEHPNTFVNMKKELPEQCKHPLSHELISVFVNWLQKNLHK
ncbi:hypothetical protein BJ742DRAFT_119646 [Cladochytrium replicatum]|nr:hypothetical protein BJ742DRAFT_119646 [Cladochytrium replicatum]